MVVGGQRLLSQITVLDEKTIRRGQQEQEASLADRPREHMSVAGAGRKPAEKKTYSWNWRCSGSLSLKPQAIL